jgi:Flp pilus assembly protein TadB
LEGNEAHEAHELQEHAEHGQTMRPVAFSMSLLAVLVAVTTVLGHRTHTEAVLSQNKATDQWNEYQARKIRSNDTSLMDDLLSVVAIQDKASADKLRKTYTDHQTKWADELQQSREKAEALEKEVVRAERRANLFDLAEALLEIGLVITSVTLLTRSYVYWYFGIVFALAGVALVISAFFLA